MGKVRALLFTFILALAAASYARAGTIEGTVRDDKTGEALIGAAVKVVGTSLGGSTDLDGKFAISGVPAGTYSLRVLYSGYSTKVMTGIIVSESAGANVTVKLESLSATTGDAMRIEDIYVTADKVTHTSAAILSERQRAAVIGDGISAEQIRLSPDGTSSDALKRVTGLSIVDDKFVFVRGVTDRYNGTTLNGVAVNGTDTNVDKKSFSFDLIPSSLISNTVVVKTATPDLPGDFSGGLVQVNTLDFPAGLLVSASAELGDDDVSSKRDIRVAPGGGDDWKGTDDGSRALPPGKKGDELAQALPNTWGTSGDTSRRNSSYALSVGDRFEFGGGELGFIASGTYKDTYKVEDYSQEPKIDGQRIFKYDGTRFRQKILWGGLVNLSYRPWPNHKFSFENNYTRSAEDKVTQSVGLPENGDTARVQVIEWSQRDLRLSQVSGDHTFPRLKEAQLKWVVAGSTSHAEQPDRKFATYQNDGRGNYLLKENYRTWSVLEEKSTSIQSDATFPLGETKLKAGFLHLSRDRSYDTEAWVTDTSHLDRQHRTLVIEPIDKIFDGDNYGTGKFDFVPSSPFTGVYDGSHDLTSYYGMVDSPFRVLEQRFRFASGARVEDSKQRVDSPVAADDPTILTARIDRKDVLPSANLAYEVTRAINFRLAYYKSVNRPEFREMANVLFRDFDQNQNVVGNPELKRAVIDNYDARVEWFPGPGEVVATSYFRKSLTDAIEEQLLPSPDKFLRTWFNSPEATNNGYEIEVRKNLGFAWRRLENLMVQGNYTHVASEVHYTESHTDAHGNAVEESKTRTMQGQAPYTVNAGIVYSVPQIGLSASLLFNKFGRRLSAVGDTRERDVYQEARSVYDFALTERFTNWSTLKFTIKDITAEDYLYTFGATGSTWERIKAGTTYAVSLSFNL